MFTHYYHRAIRNYITVFGNLFNNITLVRYDSTFTRESNRIKVPLVYGPKEKWVARYQTDPDLNSAIQHVLPAISYQMTGMTYDNDRKKSTLQRETMRSTTDGSRKTMYTGAPYDFSFKMTVHAKNLEDGYQIIEQIIPYFQPDFTITTDQIPSFTTKKDLVIALLGVSENVEYEGDSEEPRYCTWDLEFNLKGEIWGPIQESKIIKRVIVKLYDNILEDKYIRITVNNGSGRYMIGDTVYQGTRPDYAWASGEVQYFNSNTGILQLKNTQGTFLTNSNVYAMSSNSSWNLAGFQLVPPVMQRIEIVPNPLDAEPKDNYGYTTTVDEFPDAQEN